MFDRVIEKPRPRPWTTVVIIGSAIAHGLALAVLIVAGMWKIDKLQYTNTTDITFSPRPPPGDAGRAPGKKLDVLRPKVVTLEKKVVKDTQPALLAAVVPPVAATPPDAAPGDGDGPGDGPGDGDGPDGDGTTGTGDCPVAPCAPDRTGDEPAEPDVVPDVVKPVNLPPQVARGLRISGNEKIYPPESVKVDMLHQGKDTLQGTFQICVGTRGLIESVRIMKSTGYRSYDDELTGEMRQWRYRPYLVGGLASPMCAVEVVVFRMRK